jgi:hypothetical protein
VQKLELFGRYRRSERTIVTFAAIVGLSGAPAGASGAMPMPPGCNQSGQIVSCTQTFNAGSNPFTVPAGVTSIHVVAIGGMGSASAGGSGGSSVGGFGAMVSGELQVSGGSTLHAVVGANGENDLFARSPGDE